MTNRIAISIILLLLLFITFRYIRGVQKLHNLPIIRYEDIQFKTGDMLLTHSDYFYRLNPAVAVFMNLGPQMWSGTPENHVVIVIVRDGKPYAYQPGYSTVKDEYTGEYVRMRPVMTDLEDYIKKYNGAVMYYPIHSEIEYMRVLPFLEKTHKKRTECSILRYVNQVWKIPISRIENKTTCTELMAEFMHDMDIMHFSDSHHLISPRDLRTGMLTSRKYGNPVMIDNIYVREIRELLNK